MKVRPETSVIFLLRGSGIVSSVILISSLLVIWDPPHFIEVSCNSSMVEFQIGYG